MFSNKGKARRGVTDSGPEDDGDYATLRELPLMTSLDPADDSTSEENKVNVRFFFYKIGVKDFSLDFSINILINILDNIIRFHQKQALDE